MDNSVYMRVATDEQLMKDALEEFQKDPRTFTIDEVEEALKKEWNK